MTLRVFCVHTQSSQRKTPRRDFAVSRGPGLYVCVPGNGEAAHQVLDYCVDRYHRFFLWGTQFRPCMLFSFPHSVDHNSSRIDHRVHKNVIGSILLLCLCRRGRCLAWACFVMTPSAFCVQTQLSHRKTPRRDFAVSRGSRLCVPLITATLRTVSGCRIVCRNIPW